MRFKDTLGISLILGHLTHGLGLQIERSLKSLHLTLPQYSALSALESEDCLTNAEIARRSLVTPQTMNRILENLLENNLIKKKSDPSHGRKLQYSLTKKAEDLICKAHVEVNNIEKNLIHSLSQKEYKKFKETLEVLLKQSLS